MPQTHANGTEPWPSLPVADWQDTYATLHMWMQIVGKVRLAQAPRQNHWWHSTLYVTAHGLTTAPMPHRQRTFQIDFDFIDHQVRILTSAGGARVIALSARSVADFYAELMAALQALGLPIKISTLPQEVANPIPFEQDHTHTAYDPAYAQRFWRILVQAERMLQLFRARFIGKCSPVHFFWGSFDLAVTRFSGRRAPKHPGGIPHMADAVTWEAYSHEVSSCGFWPGGGAVTEPMFYAYAYPEPDAFKDYSIQPAEAFYYAPMREFFLPYEAVRRAPDPDTTLLAFAQSTCEAAANLGRWERTVLEQTPT